MFPSTAIPRSSGSRTPKESLLITPVVGGKQGNSSRYSRPRTPPAHVRVSSRHSVRRSCSAFKGRWPRSFGDPTVQTVSRHTGCVLHESQRRSGGNRFVTSIHLDSCKNQVSQPRRHGRTSQTRVEVWTRRKPRREGCGALHFNPTISLTPDIQQGGCPDGAGREPRSATEQRPRHPATPDLWQGRW